MVREAKISDLHLAAYLVTKGYVLMRVEGARGNREFVFGDVPEEEMVRFFSADERVSARALLDALRNLKGMVAQGF